VRDAVRKIHGAINRIDDPAMVRLGITQDTFFAQDSDVRVGAPQRFLDQFLAAHIQFEFDIVLRR
jgi:hypothetical protein